MADPGLASEAGGGVRADLEQLHELQEAAGPVGTVLGKVSFRVRR